METIPDTGNAGPTDAIWYFDFISPYAYLQLQKVIALRERIAIRPRPIVFGAVLAHSGQLGPAEVPGKREFTYRSVQWRADHTGIALRFPPAHPFNPIASLRLAIACGTSWESIAAIFGHIWEQGAAGDTADSLTGVAALLGIADIRAALAAAAVKEELRANTDEAIASGVFGVPTLRIGARLFWGDDATPMIRDFLDDPARFASGEFARLETLPNSVERAR